MMKECFSSAGTEILVRVEGKLDRVKEDKFYSARNFLRVLILLLFIFNPKLPPKLHWNGSKPKASISKNVPFNTQTSI